MNTSTVRRQRRILTPTETQKFEQQVLENARDGKETEQFFPGEDRAGIADKQVGNIRTQLKNNTPRPLTGAEKNEREKRLVFIKEYLVKNMVPKSGVVLRQQSGGVQNPDFRKAANLMAKSEMSPQFQALAQEWKNICRELGRPEEANLEYIRPS